MKIKKIISAILALVLVSGALTVCVTAEDSDLKVTVVADIHHNLEKSVTPFEAEAGNAWAHVGNAGKMARESAAILDSFIKQASAEDTDFMFICGDIADSGSYEESEYMARVLEKFERDTGKTVFVCIGNHECNKLTADEFKTIYANLGYDKAIAVDENSSSYAADLNDEYRLISIDTANYGKDKAGLTAERLDWVGKQAKQAKKDGKKLISMTHHNLFDHYALQSVIFSDNVVDSKLNAGDKFIKWGIKYNFCGHTHENDIASYSNLLGTVYDVCTCSLTTYPCAYRNVTFSKDSGDFGMRYITSVNTALFPKGISKTAKKLAKDFTAYEEKAFYEGCAKYPRNYLTSAKIMQILKLEGEDTEAILDKVMPKAYDVLYAPIYEGDNCVAELAKKFGTTIPESEYESVLAAGITAYMAHLKGDENMPAYGTEVQIVVKGLAVGINYALSDVTKEDYVTFISAILTRFGYADKVPGFLVDFASGALTRMGGCELAVLTVVSPVLGAYTVDNAPADLETSLPGYSARSNPFTSVIEFFETFFGFFDTFFRVITAG